MNRRHCGGSPLGSPIAAGTRHVHQSGNLHLRRRSFPAIHRRFTARIRARDA
jgi:hypothetical protein